MKGVADTINTYYRDKIDVLNRTIPPTNHDTKDCILARGSTKHAGKK